jgi:hypothetical protein
MCIMMQDIQGELADDASVNRFLFGLDRAVPWLSEA